MPNLNPTTAPKLPRWLHRAYPKYAERMWRRCQVWDTDIIRDCDESCAEEEARAAAAGDAAATPSNRWKRNDKCRSDVRANLGRQFVPADPILALVLYNDDFPSQPASITHSGADEDYPVVTVLDKDDPRVQSCKTFTWTCLKGSEVIPALDKLLE